MTHAPAHTRPLAHITLPLMIAAAMFAAAPSSGGDIVLRASVRLADDGRTVRLGDIAQLDGDEARGLADTIIGEVPQDQHVAEFTVSHVRAALDEAGAHWGRINLNGSRVVVRARRGDAGAPMMAMQGASIAAGGAASASSASQSRDEITAEAIINEPTVRGQIARLIMQQLGRPADAIRLMLDEADEAILSQTTGDVRYEVALQSSAHATSVPVKVRGWRDGDIVEHHDLIVRPLVQVQAVTALRKVDRQEQLGREDLDVRSLWLPPNEAMQLAGAQEAVGQTATRSLRPGDVIRTQHLQPQIVIQRGDLVEVRCLVGGVVISMQAEARASGAADQMIELRKIGERQTFMARVAGPGEAILDLSKR